MPYSTDPRIEALTAAIRKLCAEPFSPEAEADLRRLAQELRVAIQQHVKMAQDSLSAKKQAIDQREPKQEE